MAGFPVAVVQHIPAPPSPLTSSGSGFLSDNGEIIVQLLKDAKTNANIAQISRPGDETGVQWYPRSVKYIGDSGLSDIIYNADKSSPVELHRNVHAKYDSHFPNIDDRFVVEAGQLKHYVTVNTEQRSPLAFIKHSKLAINGVLTFDPSYRVRMNGMVMTGKFTAPGALDIVDEEGRTVYVLPQVEAWDQNGNTVLGSYVVNTLANGQLDLSMAIDQSWLASDSIVYPVVIDPTVIVSSAYDTSGNGGRKIVRLSNNWIVTGFNDSTGAVVRFYVSKDNGQTWAQLCNLNTYVTTGGFAMASSGTTVYILMTSMVANSSSALFYRFDAATVTNTSQSQISYPDSGQSSFGSGVSLVIDSTGKLWAVWCSKNSTYPNSFNIRVSSSTDGGTTWATPTQVTTYNTSGVNMTNPCIVLRSNNNPTIIYQGTNNYTIEAAYWTGSAWNINNTVYNSGGSTYTQSNPCAAVDSNDVIHVVWHGEDSTDTTYQNVRYSKSSDGGSTWSTMTKLTSGNTQHQQNASITVDSNNNLYVFWEGGITGSGTVLNVRRVTYSGGSWGSIVNVTSYTSGGWAYEVQTLWSEFNMNSNDAVRYMYLDNQTTSVKYDSIILNSPPNAPTLTTHGNFDATTAQAFAWTFSDPDSGNTQSAYQIQFVDVSTGTTVLDSGKVASTASTYNLAANALSDGKQYQWRVMTWDNSGAPSPWSSYSTFYTAASPTVTMTSPTSGSTVTTSSITAQFSYSDPAANAQQSYQVQLLDSTDATILSDSGTIASSNNQYTIPYTLANSTTYHVRARATNSKGITSAWSDVSFSTSFTPPAAATTTATPDNPNARITLNIADPAPTGSQPTVASHDLYRRNSGSAAWERIATGLAAGTYYDYAVASGQGYDYKVTAYGNNGTQTDSTVISNVSVGQLRGLWIHDVSNPSGTILNLKYMHNSGGGDGTTPNGAQLQHQATTLQFAGRSLPNVEFGESYQFTLTKGKVVLLDTDGAWPNLENQIRVNKPTFCFRDGRGRVIFGNITTYNATDMIGGTQVDLILTQTSYSMTV